MKLILITVITPKKPFAGKKKLSNTIVNMYPGLNKVDYLAPNMN